MRVTQSMLSNNMLRNLNTNYNKMSTYQDQLNSGKMINRPSDDPVVAVKGMGYRIDLDKKEQYQRNIRQAHTWLDSTDKALDQVGNVLNRVKSLIVKAANDTNTTADRQKINQEITQIKQHIQDLANTKVAENYIFSGTNTSSPLFKTDGTIQTPTDLTGLEKPIEVNVFDGIKVQINTGGVDLFGNIDNFMTELQDLLNSDTSGEKIGQALGASFTNGASPTIPGLDALTEALLVKRAEIGAKQNRVELMEERLSLQEINISKQMSLNEDTDYAKTITKMVTAESIHQASLSVGAKIIQQTLVDFIR
ncbi:flagellar hook-associated protein FlgL [Lysinibacillus fusiformis]|uniref:flagellar hook-associated protein FlgL n=1 Tax=Lysinibacillus sp. PWR01 TaxID=3342384 RepID=UPI00372D1079